MAARCLINKGVTPTMNVIKAAATITESSYGGASSALRFFLSAPAQTGLTLRSTESRLRTRMRA